MIGRLLPDWLVCIAIAGVIAVVLTVAQRVRLSKGWGIGGLRVTKGKGGK